MRTRLLYYEDAYLRSFNAKVLETIAFKDKPAVILSETAFFPEGGGQSSDIGIIGGCAVEDVQIVDGEIYHILSSEPDFKAGGIVEGKIDFEKRFDAMQQHTAEHMFSGVIHNLYGLDNVGFHLGNAVVTMDFPRMLGENELKTAEEKVNEAIWANKSVRAFFPTVEQLAGLKYRSKKEVDGPLRLVEIDGLDLCACCAPHVRSTGEIGFAEIIGVQSLRGGCRISFLAGRRAFDDIKAKTAQNKCVATLLSEQENATFDAVKRVVAARDELNFKLNEANTKLIQLKADAFAKQKQIITESEYTGDELRRFADLLSKKADDFVLALSPGQSRQFVLIGREEILPAVMQKLKENFNVRGGGRGGIRQGTINANAEAVKNILRSESLDEN